MSKHDDEYMRQWVAKILDKDQNSPEVIDAVKKINTAAIRDNVSISQAITSLEQLYFTSRTALEGIARPERLKGIISLLPNGAGGGGYEETIEVIGRGGGPSGNTPIGPAFPGVPSGRGGGREPGGGGSRVGGNATGKIAPNENEEVDAELDEKDLVVLRTIAVRDKAISDLFKEQEWADAILTVLKIITPGPAKIFLQISGSQVEAWGKINGGIDHLAQVKTCELIDMQNVEAWSDGRHGAVRFWELLSMSRGCN